MQKLAGTEPFTASAGSIVLLKTPVDAFSGSADSAV
jgi:hypothetical protein